MYASRRWIDGGLWLWFMCGLWLCLAPQQAAAQADLVMKTWSTSLNTARGAGTSMTIQFDVLNRGNGSAGTFEVSFYYGDSSSFRTLTKMGTAQLPALPQGTSTGKQTIIVTLPTTVAWGVRYIHFYIDPAKKIPERSDTNNYSGVSAFPARRITITGLPDIRAEVLRVQPASQVPGGVVSVAYRIYNAGYSRVTTYFDTRFYYSNNNTLGKDTYLTYFRLNSLNAQTYYPTSGNGVVNVTVPSSARLGLGYIIMHADYSNRIVNEILEKNNTKVASFAVVALKPELSMSLFSASSSVAGYNSSRVVTFTVKNSGGANAGPFEVSFYYGQSTRRTGLYLLARKTINRIDPGKDTGRLAVTLLMPKEVTIYTRYLHYFVDSAQNVSEVNESNNRGYRSIRVTGYPNLQVSALTAIPVSQMPGGEIDLKYTVFNTSKTGTTRAYNTTQLRFYYSTDTSFSTSRDTNLGEVTIPRMNAASSYSGTFRVKLPKNAVAGTRYIFAWADITNRLPEQSNNDNGRRADITVSRAIADLEMSAWSAPATTNGAGSKIAISYTVRNLGNADAGKCVVAFYYSDTSAFSGITPLTTVLLSALRAGQTLSGKVTVVIPNNVLQGKRTIHYWIDTEKKVAELNETNNRGKRNITITGLPNLQIDTLSIVPTQQIPGGQVRVSFRVVNKGASRAAASTTARFFFSTDGVITKGDTPLSAVTVSPLNVGELYPKKLSGQVTVTIPSAAAQGIAYLGIFADEPDSMREGVESDNTKAVPVQLVGSVPDLEMGPWKLSKTNLTGAGDSVTVTFQVRNKGKADAGPFTVAFYYGDSTRTTGLVLLGSTTISGVKTGVLSSVTTVTVTLPKSVQHGKRYIHYAIDPTEQVGEVTELNNRGFTEMTLAGKPNLKVSVLSIAPSQQVASGKVAITYRVVNDGKTRLATPTTIKFYDSKDGTIESTDNLLASLPLHTLDVGGKYPAAGDGVVVVTIPSGLRAGSSRFLGAFVDPELRVSESIETDNTKGAILSIVSHIADLQMSSFSIKPTTVGGANSSVDVAFRIKNTGNLDAVSFDVSIYYGDTKDPKNIVKLGSVAVRRVDAKTTDSKRTLTVKLPASALHGDRYLHFWIDSKEAIRELDEQNNRGTAPLKITALPNLQVSKFTVNTNVQDQGRDIVVSYRLYNAGLVRAENFKVSVSLKKGSFTKTLHSFSLNFLDALVFSPTSLDGTIKIRIPTGIPAGGHDLILAVDAENVIKELLETDNQKKIGLLLRANKPDLLAKQVSVLPTSQQVGRSVTLSYTIENLLDVAIPSVRVGLYFSKDARFDSSDPQVHTFVLNSIKGKQTRQNKVTFSLPSSLPGGKGRLFLVLDDNKKIAEFDETNNETSTAFEVFVDRDKDNVFSDKDCNDNDKSVYPGAPELCDGKDNNCNNKIDDDPRCVCKSSDPPRPCYSGGQECSKQTDGSYLCKGLCKQGKQSCSKGQWGRCVGEVKPASEVCDGKDNDCNGKTDDTLVRQCFSASTGCTKSSDGFYRCNTPCRAGLQSCTGGQWASCSGEIKPVKELCDGVDNDCDGQIDNQPISSKPLERACQNSCGSGVEICQKAQWTSCSAPSCEPGPEPKSEITPDSGPSEGGATENPVNPDADCYKLGCSSGQICQKGQCINDPCVGKSCAADEFCRGGTCVKACDCLSCPKGKMCVDGKCEIDPCSNTTCSGGEVCNPQNAQCRPDPCSGVSCDVGQVCEEGKCVDDLCSYIKCPQSQTCRRGQCVGTRCPTPEPNGESSKESSGSDGASPEDVTSEASSETKSKEPNGPDKAITGSPEGNTDLAAPPTGCSCHLPSSPGPLSWLLLLFVVSIFRRLRRSS